MDREDVLMAAETGGAAAVCFPEDQTEDAVADEVCTEGGAEESASSGPHVQSVDAHGEVRTRQVIEALLFASDMPLSAGKLAELSGIGSVRTVRDEIAALNEAYADAGLSFRIEEIAKGYQMLTLPAYQSWLVKLQQQTSQSRLTPAALETLAIVAYKQPVIRADVEAIRGVACGEVLNRLREMGLVRIIGRAEIVGRPMLYGTTKKFLDVFGLADLDDLPPIEALKLKPVAKMSTEDTPHDEDGETRVAAAGA